MDASAEHKIKQPAASDEPASRFIDVNDSRDFSPHQAMSHPTAAGVGDAWQATKPAGRTTISQSWLLWLSLFIVALLTITVRLSYDIPGTHTDEAFHLLAARSLVDHGSMQLTEGAQPYERAAAFTYMVAGSYLLFGDSLASAQIPSFAAAVLLVLLMFYWLKQQAGWTAAWVASLLTIGAMDMVHFSYVVRFYMVQTLLVWIMAIAAYSVLHQSLSRLKLGVALAIGVVAAGLATHLQITTAIAIGGVGLYGMGIFAYRMIWGRDEGERRFNLIMFVGLAVAGAGLFALAWQMGIAQDMIRKYQKADLWVGPDADNPLFYVQLLTERFGWLFWGLPVAIGLGLWKHRQATIFLTVVWLIALAGQSFGGFKALRYLLYALPMFLAIWGLAGAAVAEVLWKSLRQLGPKESQIGRGLAVAGLVLAMGVGVYGLYRVWEYNSTLRIAMGQTQGPYLKTDWAGAGPSMADEAEHVDVVVTNSSPLADYFVGRHDITLDMSLLDRREEFAYDWRSDGPVISTADSLQTVMSQYDTGLILLDGTSWRQPWGIPDSTADFIDQELEPLPIDPAWRMKAFRWGTEQAAAHAD